MDLLRWNCVFALGCVFMTVRAPKPAKYVTVGKLMGLRGKGFLRIRVFYWSTKCVARMSCKLFRYSMFDLCSAMMGQVDVDCCR